MRGEAAAVGLARRSLTAAGVVAAVARTLDVDSDWPKQAALVGTELAGRHAASAIWATSTPVSSLWAANRIAQQVSLPWVADLRDSMEYLMNAGDAALKPLVRRARPIIREARTVIEVTPEYAERDAQWLGRPCRSITSGFHPDQWESLQRARPRHRHLQLVLVGKIHSGYRTGELLFAGLHELAVEMDVPLLRVSYYGRSQDEVRALARKHQVDRLVDCRGFVPPAELRQLLVDADVLFLPTNEHGHSGVPGGKFYEYLAARRPILAAPADDRFVTNVLRATRAGLAAASATDVASALARWREEKAATGDVAYCGLDAEVARYSMREGARQLAEALDETIADKRTRLS